MGVRHEPARAPEIIESGTTCARSPHSGHHLWDGGPAIRRTRSPREAPRRKPFGCSFRTSGHHLWDVVARFKGDCGPLLWDPMDAGAHVSPLFPAVGNFSASFWTTRKAQGTQNCLGDPIDGVLKVRDSEGSVFLPIDGVLKDQNLSDHQFNAVFCEACLSSGAMVSLYWMPMCPRKLPRWQPPSRVQRISM